MPYEIHGMKGTKEYSAWLSMKGRCLCETNKKFYRYGGRGISIYDKWIDSFSKFYDHIGPAPAQEYSLDRIDCNEGYYPGNIRWATAEQQANNQPRIESVEFMGRVGSLSQHSRWLGLNYRGLQSARYRGKTTMEVLNKYFEEKS